MRDFLHEVSRQNAGIARNLRALRRRAESAVRDAAIADTVLDARDSMHGGGDVPSDRSAVGSGSLPGARDPSLPPSPLDDPLRMLRSLDTTTITPLAELETLAQRAEEVLRQRQSRQRALLVTAGLTIGTQLGIAVVLAVTDAPLVAAALLITAMALAAMVQWMWRPLDRLTRIRKLAALAQAMAQDIRERLESISEISDASARQLAQWKAVVDLTASIAG
ncbi:MAG: hypothetical protein R3A51_20465 [Nannocystaceae bacterium]|nr:hypothetical protein [Myxococcales bacterium]